MDNVNNENINLDTKEVKDRKIEKKNSKTSLLYWAILAGLTVFIVGGVILYNYLNSNKDRNSEEIDNTSSTSSIVQSESTTTSTTIAHNSSATKTYSYTVENNKFEFQYFDNWEISSQNLNTTFPVFISMKNLNDENETVLLTLVDGEDDYDMKSQFLGIGETEAYMINYSATQCLILHDYSTFDKITTGEKYPYRASLSTTCLMPSATGQENTKTVFTVYGVNLSTRYFAVAYVMNFGQDAVSEEILREIFTTITLSNQEPMDTNTDLTKECIGATYVNLKFRIPEDWICRLVKDEELSSQDPNLVWALLMEAPNGVMLEFVAGATFTSKCSQQGFCTESDFYTSDNLNYKLYSYMENGVEKAELILGDIKIGDTGADTTIKTLNKRMLTQEELDFLVKIANTAEVV